MRISKERYIMEIAFAAAKRASCPKAAVGAVFITEDFEVLAMGFNGAPRGFPHCLEIGCDKDINGKCQRSIHSEIAAIIQGAKRGTPLGGSSLYITQTPCRKCAAALINLGIKSVVVPENSKKNLEGCLILKTANIPLFQLTENNSIIQLS